MKQENHIASAIRHLASSLRGELVAAAFFEHKVSLWNIFTREQVSEFETILDFGGSRLALSQSNAACLAAAFYIHGLACYTTPTGNLRWQRKDLKRVQSISITPDETHAYCCVEGGPCQIIDITNGETTDRVRGLREVWFGTHSHLQLRETSKLTVVDLLERNTFRIEPDSWAVLDAVFSKNHLAISEAGADVRIFDLSSGREVARYAQPKNHHVLQISSIGHESVFYGVQWNYQCGGPKSLLRFRLNSIEADVIYNLGESAEFTFCEGGKYILSSEGDLVDCAMGKVVGRLPFPKMEYPKH